MKSAGVVRRPRRDLASALVRRIATGLGLLLVFCPVCLADLRREVEPNDLAGNAQPITPPASVGGVIAFAGDVDLYAVAASAGQTIIADVLARGFRADNNPGSDLSALLEIRDTDGITVLAQGQSLGEFDDPAAMAEAPSDGVYFVAVRDLSNSGGPSHRYVLSFEVGSNDSAGDATRLEPPVLPSIDALLYPPNDRDYYRLSGSANQVLTVDIDSAVFNPPNPAAKVVLTVLDGMQTILAQDAYSASDPEDPFIQVTLPLTGDYFILVRELRSFVGTTNTFYQMSVELGPSAGNDSFAEGMPVVLPRAVSGVISTSADVDHFRIVLGENADLNADVDAQEGLISLLDGEVAVHDATGILASDASVPDPQLIATLAPGAYSVSVSGPCAGHGCDNEDSYYVLFLDADIDGDGLVLPADNCPAAGNPGQEDRDGDGVGDACDNCLAVFNPDQMVSNGNGSGDACTGVIALPAMPLPGRLALGVALLMAGMSLLQTYAKRLN